jgi:hypothetical protein
MWKTISEGPLVGPSVGSAQLFEKTERSEVTGKGTLIRTTVFRADGGVVSVALATFGKD